MIRSLSVREIRTKERLVTGVSLHALTRLSGDSNQRAEVAVVVVAQKQPSIFSLFRDASTKYVLSIKLLLLLHRFATKRKQFGLELFNCVRL